MWWCWESANGSPWLYWSSRGFLRHSDSCKPTVASHSHWFPVTQGILDPGRARPPGLMKGLSTGRDCTFPWPAWSFHDPLRWGHRMVVEFINVYYGYPSETILQTWRKSGTTIWIHLDRLTISGWQVSGKGQMGPAMRMNRLQSLVYFLPVKPPIIGSWSMSTWRAQQGFWTQAAFTISSGNLKINGRCTQLMIWYDLMMTIPCILLMVINQALGSSKFGMRRGHDKAPCEDRKNQETQEDTADTIHIYTYLYMNILCFYTIPPNGVKPHHLGWVPHQPPAPHHLWSPAVTVPQRRKDASFVTSSGVRKVLVLVKSGKQPKGFQFMEMTFNMGDLDGFRMDPGQWYLDGVFLVASDFQHLLGMTNPKWLAPIVKLYSIHSMWC